jgi:hypothetical protein
VSFLQWQSNKVPATEHTRTSPEKTASNVFPSFFENTAYSKAIAKGRKPGGINISSREKPSETKRLR